MKRRVMRQEDVAEFCRYLQGEERSQGTIETYRREIRAFAATLPENRVVTKEVVVAWKETLAKRYAVSTVNGKLAALNGLFSFLGWREMRALSTQAGVGERKVFPHNFRHLFARAFYSLEKDMAKLADLLGHASVETTRIYIMESGAEHKRQVERLGLVI